MKDIYNSFLNNIKDLDCSILEKEPMAKHTTFKIGGLADLFITVNTKKSLIEILKAIKLFKLSHHIIGNGSNLLISDEGLKYPIIKLGEEFKKIKILDETPKSVKIKCGSAVLNAEFCIFAKENFLSGAEFLYGIPGTIGGALYMNAGAYLNEISNITLYSECITKSFETLILNRNQMNFSYRNSIYSKTKDIITSAIFELKKSNKLEVEEKMDFLLKERKKSQPLNFPSAGSIFKKPKNNISAGELIESCDLKDLTVGNAKVSTKHAGFIVNIGTATSKDVLKLINIIKETVFKKTGIILNTEIEYWC